MKLKHKEQKSEINTFKYWMNGTINSYEFEVI